MITQKEINRYIKDIKKELLYNSKQSREFLAGLRQNVCDFAAENENADIGAVKEHFGKPEEIAATFFEQYDKNEIKRKVNVRRVAVIVGIMMFLVFAIGVSVIVMENREEIGYLETHIIEYVEACIKPIWHKTQTQ